MIAELLQEVKTEFREFPELAAMVLLALVVGIGVNTAVFSNAVGSEVQVRASRGRSAAEQIEQMEWLRAHHRLTELTPGLTVIVELRRYSVELNVPFDGVRSLFDDAQADVA
ncbi:MAG: hypothetical protein ABI164_03495 [Acidobacteriaceae bacterium]